MMPFFDFPQAKEYIPTKKAIARGAPRSSYFGKLLGLGQYLWFKGDRHGALACLHRARKSYFANQNAVKIQRLLVYPRLLMRANYLEEALFEIRLLYRSLHHYEQTWQRRAYGNPFFNIKKRTCFFIEIAKITIEVCDKLNLPAEAKLMHEKMAMYQSNLETIKQAEQQQLMREVEAIKETFAQWTQTSENSSS